MLANLNNAAGLLDRLFTDLPGFSKSSLPAIKSLGQASITGRQAAVAAGPTIADLNQFAKPTPELAQNLAIVLHDLDNRKRAVEPDSRSPGGRGFTGLEALLQYVFNQTLAINGFGQFGHFLAVDAFVDPDVLAVRDAAERRQQSGRVREDVPASATRGSGPTSPGSTRPIRRTPSACVPDPGGAPPGEPGPKTTACRLKASPLPIAEVSKRYGEGAEQERHTAHDKQSGDERAWGWPRSVVAAVARSRGDPPGHVLERLRRRREPGTATSQLPPVAMRMRRSQRSAFANPVLVGAITVLVLLVAVFLAYNANTGLPFVPTKQLNVDFADGSNLVVGNDVREGGFQVGIVSALKPVILASGQVGAQARCRRAVKATSIETSPPPMTTTRGPASPYREDTETHPQPVNSVHQPERA